MIYLTRLEKFNAAHKLYVAEWTEEKNKAVFGKCANANWHGHNYRLEVTVKGKPDPITGFVIDAKKLSVIIKEHVTEKLDHKNLNMDVAFLPKLVQPTTENLVYYIWHELKDKVSPSILHEIKLAETDTISASYFGEALND